MTDSATQRVVDEYVQALLTGGDSGAFLAPDVVCGHPRRAVSRSAVATPSGT